MAINDVQPDPHGPLERTCQKEACSTHAEDMEVDRAGSSPFFLLRVTASRHALSEPSSTFPITSRVLALSPLCSEYSEVPVTGPLPKIRGSPFPRFCLPPLS